MYKIILLLISFFSILNEGCSSETSAEPFSDNDLFESPTPLPKGMSLLNSISVITNKTLSVRIAPSEYSTKIGIIVKGTRTSPLEFKKGNDCIDGWIKIVEKGWVCSKYLSADSRTPSTEKLPIVKEGNLLPGVYADIVNKNAILYPSINHITKALPVETINGHTVVQKKEDLTVLKKKYWRTTTGEIVSVNDLKIYKPSEFHGIDLDENINLPLLFILPTAENPNKPAYSGENIYEHSAGRGYARVLEKVSLDKKKPLKGKERYKYRISGDKWLSGSLIRYAEATPIPPDIKNNEKWIDLNLDEQVLVAYEGSKPIFVTLVSSGRYDPTPRGLFRVYAKYSETSMGSRDGDDRPYEIQKVPWTQFFYAGIAFHCAYWHNGFGYPRSRGCVNLSPMDAKFLFDWTNPELPPGWNYMSGIESLPGTLVRLHKTGEKVHYYGYARDMAKRQGVKLPPAPKLTDQLYAEGEILRAKMPKKILQAPLPKPSTQITPDTPPKILQSELLEGGDPKNDL